MNKQSTPTLIHCRRYPATVPPVDQSVVGTSGPCIQGQIQGQVTLVYRGNQEVRKIWKRTRKRSQNIIIVTTIIIYYNSY